MPCNWIALDASCVDVETLASKFTMFVLIYNIKAAILLFSCIAAIYYSLERRLPITLHSPLNLCPFIIMSTPCAIFSLNIP